MFNLRFDNFVKYQKMKVKKEINKNEILLINY